MLHTIDHRIRSGDSFFRAGQDGQGMFVLLEGRAVAALEDNNSCFVLREFLPGDSFGEAAGIDLQPRSYSVHASTDCVALGVGAEAFSALQAFDAEQFTLFYMNIAREFSRRLRICEERAFRYWRERSQIHEENASPQKPSDPRAQ
ncbi:MAG: cyclic nucleotide-binding domain-containing protein [Granulosicoccaceae bacterium]